MNTLTNFKKSLFGFSFVATTIIVAAALAFVGCDSDSGGGSVETTTTITLDGFTAGDVVGWEAPSMANYLSKYFIAKDQGSGEDAKVVVTAPKGDYYELTKVTVVASNTDVANTADGWYVTTDGDIKADATGGIYAVETVQANGTLGEPKYVKAVSSGVIVASGTGIYKIKGAAITAGTSADTPTETATAKFVVGAVNADGAGGGIYAIETVGSDGKLGAPVYKNVANSGAITTAADTIYRITGAAVKTTVGNATAPEATAWYSPSSAALVAGGTSDGAGIYAVQTLNTATGVLSAPVYKNVEDDGDIVATSSGVYKITGYVISTSEVTTSDNADPGLFYAAGISTAGSASAGVYTVETANAQGALGAPVYKNIAISTAVTTGAGIYRVTYADAVVNDGSDGFYAATATGVLTKGKVYGIVADCDDMTKFTIKGIATDAATLGDVAAPATGKVSYVMQIGDYATPDAATLAAGLAAAAGTYYSF